MKTRQECIDEAGYALAMSNHLCAGMTPREQAEAAWTPTGPPVDELEARIREQRGLPPLQAKSA